MSDRQTNRELRLIISGPVRFPKVTLNAWFGVSETLDADGIMAAAGGCVDAILLEGAQLGRLPEANRRRLLRRSRRLLVPGGKLTVAVGSADHQYPRSELAQAAWSCGFTSGHRYAAGHAILTVPHRTPKHEPLVSILIPAYKSRHFAATLDSALAQTWPRGEIIVGDDSPNETIHTLVQDAKPRLPAGWQLRYLRNGDDTNGRWNYLNLFGEARGDYVKYLNDDDLLAPHCVARMAAALRDHPDVTLVTSYRRLIDGQGHELPDEAFNRPVLPADGRIDGRVLATLVLSRLTNLIGEPTTTMFRKADAEDNRPHLMSYAGRSARRNGDMSIWTMLLSRGDAVWFNEPLSFFRQHDDQVQRSDPFRQEARLAWIELVGDARDTGLISPTYGESGASPLVDRACATGLTDRAEAAHATGDHEAARALLYRALANDPVSSRTRGDLASLAWQAGHHDEAVLQAMLALGCPGPDHVTALNLRDMLEALGRHGQAAGVTTAFTLACAPHAAPRTG